MEEAMKEANHEFGAMRIRNEGRENTTARLRAIIADSLRSKLSSSLHP
jgi:hypothetical protein